METGFRCLYDTRLDSFVTGLQSESAAAPVSSRMGDMAKEKSVLRGWPNASGVRSAERPRFAERQAAAQPPVYLIPKRSAVVASTLPVTGNS